MIIQFQKLLLLCLSTICISCGGRGTATPETDPKAPKDFTVRILLRGNTDGLNALLSKSAISSEILDHNVHNTLLEMNPEGYELRPFLAVARPEVKVLSDGKVTMTYEIRPEATWDNGTPITGHDYAFTLKVIKNPKVNAAPLRPFFEFVEDVQIDASNPKKFTIVCSKPYMLSEFATGSAAILPAYFYDAQGLMSEFKIKELNDPANYEKLSSDPRIVDFAADFNNNYNHEPEKIVGAGPYQVTEISTHQHVKLERKKNWWGDKVKVDYIAAYPEKIMFKIIDDDNNALMSLKERELDIMTSIPEEQFLELQANDRVTQYFNLYTPNSFSYKYIGLNMKSDKMNDVKVRKAIAHLLDKKYVVDEICSGLATPVNGPVSSLKKYYNKNIPELEFNIEKAKALLAEAGWKDSDKDNILDKMVGGQKLSLKLKFLYPQGKQFYKDIAQILKDEAARVGVEIELMPTEWSVMLEDMKKRNFDLICLGWSQQPTLDDFKQVWHTSANTPEGSNIVSFGNKESDLLIDQIRETMDEAKREEMYLKFQEIVDREQPYIFLVAPKLCTAISKRFSNAPATSMRPGYMVRLLKLEEKK